MECGDNEVAETSFCVHVVLGTRVLSFLRRQELEERSSVLMWIMRRPSGSESVNMRHREIWRGTSARHPASDSAMDGTTREIFDEQYRVVAVESQSLTIRGERTGKVLTISTATPFRVADYPPGRLIALSDPSHGPAN